MKKLGIAKITFLIDFPFETDQCMVMKLIKFKIKIKG